MSRFLNVTFLPSTPLVDSTATRPGRLALRALILAFTVAALHGPRPASAHGAGVIVGRDSSAAPRLVVRGPHDYLDGRTAIPLLPGDGMFKGSLQGCHV